jgi:hypothetical protein
VSLLLFTFLITIIETFRYRSVNQPKTKHPQRKTLSRNISFQERVLYNLLNYKPYVTQKEQHQMILVGVNSFPSHNQSRAKNVGRRPSALSAAPRRAAASLPSPVRELMR